MISRIWHGYTNHADADAYEKLLKEEIFIGISSRKIMGYRGIQLLRRTTGNEIEFITEMWFETLDSVIGFAGTDYRKAVVPEKARKLLCRYDEESQHYEVRVSLVE